MPFVLQPIYRACRSEVENFLSGWLVKHNEEMKEVVGSFRS